MADAGDVTVLLQQLKAGDRTVMDRLVPLVYQGLRAVAEGRLRNERSDHTLQPTDLVHEAYLKLAGQGQPYYQNRAHFFGIASRVMRQILVDHGRKTRAAKRGGGIKLPIEEALEKGILQDNNILALDDALSQLEEQDPQKVRLLEMRYFGGLTAEESAEITGLNVQQIRRELRVAQAWLKRELDQTPERSV